MSTGDGSLARFLRLSGADRSLLIRSGLVLTLARLALWLLPLTGARRLLAWLTKPHPVQTATAERIGWAVSVASRVVPRATCLPQALAGEALLAQDRHPVALRIGVVKTDRGRLEAHAWVESAGRIVVGDLDRRHAAYTPLPPLPEPKA
ncbi:MAG TPA: lasso peptide biosynthesis B2 protein [Gemmatimonadales bacterium]|nr:lasso peptide biosynthesis B2 protein [Gemmatimonadales bacterium]